LNESIDAALDALHNGGVIAYPTEAVFGIGCNPRNETAVQKVLDIKHREAHKGLILVASDQKQLEPYLAPITAAWQTQLDAVWPGPVTFIIPAANDVSAILSGGRSTLAVRVSQHPVVSELCDRYGDAIVSTSANKSGEAPLQTGDDVSQHFGNTIDAVVDGDVGTLASPTRIIDIQTGQRLR